MNHDNFVKLDVQNLFRIYCKASKQFGILIFINDADEWNEVIKACPLLAIDDYQILGDGMGFFIFQTEKEMEEAYEHIVGDDGPTEHNKYDGLARVYALTCDDKGIFHNENT